MVIYFISLMKGINKKHEIVYFLHIICFDCMINALTEFASFIKKGTPTTQ